jgi:beta-fructofuranosidase
MYCASWEHAISFDLYTWSIQPIAFQEDDFDICGGSVVIDRNNTSGFFPHQSNGVVALYTQYHAETGLVQQAIAYSVDGGYVFTKYSKEKHFVFQKKSKTCGILK